ncbi:MAG: hypothetical protein ABI549_09050 [Flavobacterium sp.]|uniref:hypothetical protein n=1 Tax=Flavobacterium sp. TaxID=239 RepID=UPI003264F206
MAKTSGIIKIEGTIEDLTFYKKDGQNFVRKKGGIAKERILNDPNFIRTRENGSEFSHSASSGKILRTAVGSLVFKAKDSKLSSRLLQTMAGIKNLDTTSARGLRNVSNGIATAEGKQALKGFDFNNRAHLKSVLFAPYVLDNLTGTISFTDLIAAEQFHFPQGATHIALQAAFLNLDFETQISEVTYSNIANLPINLVASSPVLIPTGVPTGTGVQLYLLMISFYQEVNNVQYSLRNEEYNILNIIEVL